MDNENKLKKLENKETAKEIKIYRNFDDIFAALNFTKGSALT